MNLRRAILLGACVAIVPTVSMAGSAPAHIECKASGGQTLSGTIPRDEWELDLSLDDGKGHVTRWTDAEALTMIDRVSDQLLLMHIEDPGLRFHALPKTVKSNKGRGREDATFDAKVLVGKERAAIELRMACVYEYSI